MSTCPLSSVLPAMATVQRGGMEGKGKLTLHNSTIVFSYAGSAMMGALFAAGPLVYLIMEWSDWLSIYIGLGLFSLSLVLGLTLPYQPVAQASHAHKDNADDMGMVSRVAAGMRTFLSSIRAQLAGNRNLLLLFCSILFTSLGKSFTFILSQYCTRRYGWSWSEVCCLPLPVWPTKFIF